MPKPTSSANFRGRPASRGVSSHTRRGSDRDRGNIAACEDQFLCVRAVLKIHAALDIYPLLGKLLSSPKIRQVTGLTKLLAVLTWASGSSGARDSANAAVAESQNLSKNAISLAAFARTTA